MGNWVLEFGFIIIRKSFIFLVFLKEYLSEDALFAVKQLLPDSAEGDFASVCPWADQVRFHYHWSGPLHYIDTPDFKCNYEYCSKLWPLNLYLV